ncbi:hypothetical protein OIO90_001204 [Microbotryomycetes sp. JL221]|nr:hypothetical protein OIO90_001204 [Microbotryomycetes sp. JL221]
MKSYTAEELETVTNEAFALRLQGNEKLKLGDLNGALMDYHHVLLKLKGLESSLHTNAQAANNRAAETGSSTPASSEPSLDDKVKEAIKLVYLNSAKKIGKGTKLLQELNSETKDPAVAAALKEVEEANASKGSGSKTAFRGMFTKDVKTAKTATPPVPPA